MNDKLPSLSHLKMSLIKTYAFISEFISTVSDAIIEIDNKVGDEITEEEIDEILGIK